MRNDVFPPRTVKQPLTPESGWTRGRRGTSVFQEGTISTSAKSILKVDSFLNIENKTRLVRDFRELRRGASTLSPPEIRNRKYVAFRCEVRTQFAGAIRSNFFIKLF